VEAAEKNTDPGSSEVIDALNKLECSGRFPEGVIHTAKDLWRKAHMISNQSGWAYNPQSKEAQESVVERIPVPVDSRARGGCGVSDIFADAPQGLSRG
jgi:hypothetical protein